MTLAGPTLCFLRHCETEWSRRRLYHGQSDPPLSSQGIEHAARLAQLLVPRRSGLAAIFSSPLTRARMTASQISLRTHASVQVDPLLSEVNYGEWEGLTQADIKVRWPGLYRQWKKNPATMVFPGGESLQSFKDRVLAFLHSTRTIMGPALAVTHSGVMRVILLEAMGLSLSEFRSAKFNHGDVLEVCTAAGRLNIVDRSALMSCADSGDVGARFEATSGRIGPAEPCP